MTAARRAAWSGMPCALARFSRCLQTLAGKRTERGTVGPVSVPFFGLPRPAWMEIPSFAIRSAYGLRRTFALSKSTSGISWSETRVGSRGFLPVAFFIAFPLMGCSASRADDAERVLGLLDEDNEQNTSLLGLTDQDCALRGKCVLQHRSERVREDGSGLYERDSVLLQVRRGLLRVPREPHENKCNTLLCSRKRTSGAAIWSARGQRLSSRHRVRVSSNGRKQWEFLDPSPGTLVRLANLRPSGRCPSPKGVGPTSQVPVGPTVFGCGGRI